MVSLSRTTSLSRPPSTAIFCLILPVSTSMTTRPPQSPTYSSLPFSDNAMPLGQSRPVTHSAAITLPSTPTLPMEPLPSASQGFPSMFETYSTLRWASKYTDSGVLSVASLSHTLVSLCPSACAVAASSSAPNVTMVLFMNSVLVVRDAKYSRAALRLASRRLSSVHASQVPVPHPCLHGEVSARCVG